MIRTGRAHGWLKQPIDTLSTWATFHGVSFNGIKIGPLPGFEDRGSTVIADRKLEGGKVEPLLVVPKELIISRQNIELFAKSDRHLREVLEAAGDFGRTTRGAVLIFLLMQATICCPDIKDVGVLNPLTEYIKYLPDELLPTFWSEEEQELLTGTTLQPAVRAKLNSLLREFELVRTATEKIEWCARYWWDEDTGLVNFDDWMCVDAMYRSRALEFPGVGDCMCPCVDMANHASGDATAALYETDEDGDGLLLLRPGKDIGKDGEITITYGDDKGACENIFSYGFLEDSMASAKVMLLNIDIPDDDPLRPAKMFVSTAAPGFRLFEKDGAIDWESDFIWLVIVNEEDGLDFKVRQTVEGKREIQSLWRDEELRDTSKLREHLHGDPLWDVYHLRATVLLQGRVDVQIALLKAVGNPSREATIRQFPWSLASRLRNLEMDMLERATDALESQKSRLLESAVVQQYLGLGEESEEVDFT
ncbi:SET domain-containing protein [Didymella exigua CBS 183.55]|uniref:SET domain-containing protein n=1 Tax=Didymella exigua CBS 183.55 TaxID=1150837 RepID=A0A6A5RH95_9PLEO|nr:SET domain-containing protein [Didymella exigua CBS 183.55]KAF1927711.1 SET domain-containing protein [Didymella exigua CBS 183.55]